MLFIATVVSPSQLKLLNTDPSRSPKYKVMPSANICVSSLYCTEFMCVLCWSVHQESTDCMKESDSCSSTLSSHLTGW